MGCRAQRFSAAYADAHALGLPRVDELQVLVGQRHGKGDKLFEIALLHLLTTRPTLPIVLRESFDVEDAIPVGADHRADLAAETA